MERKLIGVVALGAWGMLIAALVFQYAMGLEPCIMCVYQRFAVLGVALGSTLTYIAPRMITWFAGGIASGSAAVYGIIKASEHTGLQKDSNPFFSSCEITPVFPLEIPLDSWVPFMFEANGPCGDIDWSLFGMSMPQWVLILLSSMLMVWIVAGTLRAMKWRFKKTEV